MNISQNLKAVLDNIDASAQQTGRKGGDVTLVAVSKYHAPEEIKAAYDCGIHDFGENHVQEVTGKIPLLPSDINWHMIGHLQTNKVSKVIDSISLLHSLDRLELAKEVNKRAGAKNISVDALVQVNITDLNHRFGVLPDETIEFVKSMENFSNIKIKGLMGMAPICDNPAEHFKVLKELFEQLKAVNLCEMKFLSMGMSADYIEAILEGSNMVRIGSGIFGQRNYHAKIT